MAAPMVGAIMGAMPMMVLAEASLERTWEPWNRSRTTAKMITVQPPAPTPGPAAG